jgi:PHD/YefM family antitoxin component YafN of YafNO toxin-antitoxin module
MNSLTAAELKRRGMAAIEERLRKGPVHLIKRNKASAVVVSAKDYARLSGREVVKESGMSAAKWLLNQPVKGRKSKRQMDADLRGARDDWA